MPSTIMNNYMGYGNPGDPEFMIQVPMLKSIVDAMNT